MKYAINLFPHEQRSLREKIVYFCLHYLRYILVITQFVVILAFFIRFQVDQQIVDEQEKLVQKKAIIQVTEPLRAELERIQGRIKVQKALMKRQEDFGEQLAYMGSVFPKDLRLNSMSMTETSISLVGESTDYRIIRAFYTRLQEDKRFAKVELISVRRVKGKYEFNFQLTNFKPKAANPPHG
jgi:Tfp pilus assembly protein PilN